MAQELNGTFEQYLIRVRRYLNESDTTKSRWTDAFLQQLFNSQYRLRCTELHMAYEGYFTLIATRDVVADQNRYAWPSGFMRSTKIEVVRSDGRRVPLQREERHYNVLNIPSSGGDDWLPTYRAVGSGFVLEPASNADITGGLHIEYLGVPEELTADGDNLHSDFPAIFDELLVLDTAVVANDAEGFHESGSVDMLVRQRLEWIEKWERYIDGRMVSRQKITPFVAHYNDA